MVLPAQFERVAPALGERGASDCRAQRGRTRGPSLRLQRSRHACDKARQPHPVQTRGSEPREGRWPSGENRIAASTEKKPLTAQPAWTAAGRDHHPYSLTLLLCEYLVALPVPRGDVQQRLDSSAQQHIAARSRGYPALLAQIYRPGDPDRLAATLSLVDRAIPHLSFYRMSATLSPDAARVACRGIFGADAAGAEDAR